MSRTFLAILTQLSSTVPFHNTNDNNSASSKATTPFSYNFQLGRVKKGASCTRIPNKTMQHLITLTTKNTENIRFLLHKTYKTKQIIITYEHRTTTRKIYSIQRKHQKEEIHARRLG